MRKMGVDPWVAHFFLLPDRGVGRAVTSLSAAVSARIAEASFVKTMYIALKLCLPVTLMTFAIFVRSEVVTNPGWPQVADTLLVLVGTLRHHVRDVRTLREQFRRCTFRWRFLLAVLSLVVLLHPDQNWAMAAAVVVVPATVFGIRRHVEIGGPASVLAPQVIPMTDLPGGGRTGVVQHQE